jgi:hypothetical protein
MLGGSTRCLYLLACVFLLSSVSRLNPPAMALLLLLLLLPLPLLMTQGSDSLTAIVAFAESADVFLSSASSPSPRGTVRSKRRDGSAMAVQ